MTSTPLPRKTKGAEKKTRSQNPGEEETIEALVQHLKGEARSVQYNLELAILNEYRNLHIPNLKGPPNTDNHSAYLSSVRDMSWSYPAKGNLITACQYYQDPEGQQRPGGHRSGEQHPAGKRKDGNPAGECQGWADQVPVCHLRPS